MKTLREWRRERLISIEELAAQTGVSTKTIVDTELGRTRPKFRTIRRLSEALLVEPADVAEFNEPGADSRRTTGAESGTMMLGEPAKATAAAGPVAFVYRGRYAQAWFDDACREAGPQSVGDGHARRREILFVACCAESYLDEWAMDLLERGLRTVEAARRVRRWRDPAPLVTRWEAFSERLRDEATVTDIQHAMTFDGAEDLRAEWANVVGWRNDLVHADVSRLVEVGRDPRRRPSPTAEVLAEKAPGWAVRILVRCVERLHEQTQTKAPAWLVLP